MNEPKANTTAASRKAWITGASKGIGRAVALELASGGWSVAASARDAAALEALAAEADQLPGAIYAYPLDVTSETAARDTFAQIEHNLGAIDLAIFNAGTHEPVDGSAFTVAPLKRLVDINLMGTAPLPGARRGTLCRSPRRANCRRRFDGRLPRSTNRQRLWRKQGGVDQHVRGAARRTRPARCRVVGHHAGFRAHAPDRSQPVSHAVPDRTGRCRAAIVHGLAGRRFEITFLWRFAAIMKLLRLLPYPLFFAATRNLVPKDKSS